jgi:hypothetical protein
MGCGRDKTACMRQNAKLQTRKTTSEDEELNDFCENLAPRGPTLRIYRIESDGRRTRLQFLSMDVFSEEYLREEFGGGTYLVRTVRSNGTWAPSRVIGIASRSNLQ